MKKISLAIVAALAAVTPFVPTQANATALLYTEAPPLLGPTAFVMPTSRSVASTMSATDPAITDVQFRDVNEALVDERYGEITIELKGGRRVIATQDYATENDDGAVIWSGSVRSAGTAARGKAFAGLDAANRVLLVRHQGSVTGNITVDGEHFRLRPLPDGGHVLLAVDPTQSPTLDHDDAVLFDPLDAPMVPSALRMPVATAAPTTVRILVAYGAEAERRTGNFHGLANLAIARANEGFRNSGIDLTFELAGVVLTRQEETHDIGRDLGLIAGKNDGFIDAIHQTRNEMRADIVTLVSGNSGGCGIGYLNPNEGGAFNVVDLNCFQGDNVFAHEAGHNLGAHHDPATLGNDRPAYSYGTGFQNYAIRQRTVMAYECQGGCAWAAAWSSPHVWIGNQAMGNDWQSDNRRVLIERKATVANFR